MPPRSSTRVWRLLCGLLLAGLTLPAQADRPMPGDLLVVTEQLPPYSFMNGQGVIDGVNTRMTRAILDKAGIEARFALYPWARSFFLTQTRADTLIYSLARSPEREKQFIWIAPLGSHERWIYRLRSQLPTSNPDLTKIRQTSTVCVVNRDIAEEDLKREGFREGKNYITTNSAADCIRLVESGGVPYLVESPESLAWELSLDWKLRHKFEALLPLPASLHEPMYLAANLNTSPTTISRLQAAASALRASGQLDQIRKDFILRLNATPSQ